MGTHNSALSLSGRSELGSHALQGRAACSPTSHDQLRPCSGLPVCYIHERRCMKTEGWHSTWTEADQTGSWKFAMPLACSSSGVRQPRAPSMAHLAWITSISRYLLTLPFSEAVLRAQHFRPRLDRVTVETGLNPWGITSSPQVELTKAAYCSAHIGGQGCQQGWNAPGECLGVSRESSCVPAIVTRVLTCTTTKPT